MTAVNGRISARKPGQNISSKDVLYWLAIEIYHQEFTNSSTVPNSLGLH